MNDNVTAHLIISGRVQGVFYRMETKTAADRFGANGWVRNKPNGTVEAMVEGEKQSVEALISWCKDGPPASRVDDVTVNWLPYQEKFTNFSITHDG